MSIKCSQKALLTGALVFVAGAASAVYADEARSEQGQPSCNAALICASEKPACDKDEGGCGVAKAGCDSEKPQCDKDEGGCGVAKADCDSEKPQCDKAKPAGCGSICGG